MADGGVIDDLYVGKVKMCLAKFETAAERLKDKTAEVQRLKDSTETAEDKGGREKAESLEREIDGLNNKKAEIENNISENKKSAESLKATENDVKRKKSGINIVFITVAGFALLAALLLFAFRMQSVALIPAAGAAVSALLSFLLRHARRGLLRCMCMCVFINQFPKFSPMDVNSICLASALRSLSLRNRTAKYIIP